MKLRGFETFADGRVHCAAGDTLDVAVYQEFARKVHAAHEAGELTIGGRSADVNDENERDRREGHHLLDLLGARGKMGIASIRERLAEIVERAALLGRKIHVLPWAETREDVYTEGGPVRMPLDCPADSPQCRYDQSPERLAKLIGEEVARAIGARNPRWDAELRTGKHHSVVPTAELEALREVARAVIRAQQKSAPGS